MVDVHCICPGSVETARRLRLKRILRCFQKTWRPKLQRDALDTYMDVLVKDAFGNYRQLLQDVTLNPAMGRYLDMLSNDGATGSQPNENYAREIMQLFSVGLYQLNLDGSLRFDSNGLPIATYSQDDVMGLAAVFTGWTYAQVGTPVFQTKPLPIGVIR